MSIQNIDFFSFFVTIHGYSKHHAKNHPAMPSGAAKPAVNSNFLQFLRWGTKALDFYMTECYHNKDDRLSFKKEGRNDLTENKKISDAELEIMKVVWKKGSPLLFAQIMEALQENGIYWQKNTLITLLSRLMEKGYLKANKCGRKNEYVSLVTEHKFQSTQTRNFVDKIYQGNVSGLINRLVENDMLTEAEYDELKKILEVK